LKPISRKSSGNVLGDGDELLFDEERADLGIDIGDALLVFLARGRQLELRQVTVAVAVQRHERPGALELTLPEDTMSWEL
jgi:hypothetical protein